MTNAVGGAKVSTSVSCLSHIMTPIAIVIRMSSQPPGGIRLKAAAALAESGEIRDTAQQLWDGSVGSRQELIDKVNNFSKPLYQTLSNELGNRPTH